MGNVATIAVAIVLATVIVCALVVFATSAPKSMPVMVCVEPEMREKVREIMLRGLDDALRRHTVRIYNTWMKDPAEQPHRARAGMRHGLDAYIGAYKVAQDWNPPPCKQE